MMRARGGEDEMSAEKRLPGGFSDLIGSLSRDFNLAMQLLSLALVTEAAGGAFSKENAVDLASLHEVLSNLESRRDAIGKGIAEDAASLSEMEALLERSKKQANELQMLHEALPATLKKAQPRAQKREVLKDDEISTAAAPTRSLKRTNSRARPTVWTNLQLVTKQELESVPKVSRGRLDAAHLNECIGELQTMFNKKSEMLSYPRNKLTDNMRRERNAYLERLVPEHNGAPFLLESEIRGCKAATAKGEATFRSILACLRHLQRLKMVKSGRSTTYCAIL